MFAKKTISKLLLLAAVSAISLVAAAACGAEEAAEPEAPAQPVAGRAADEAAAPAAPQAPTGRTGAAQAAAEPDAASGTVAKAQDPAKPKAGEAAQAAADPEKPKAAAAAEGAMMKKTTRTGGPVDLNLADEQVLNLVGQMRNRNVAPWRDGGGGRYYSVSVFGTLFRFSPKNDVLPWTASGWTVNDGLDVYTVTLRDDAVFQDGTPITAADVKAYWEHGAKPENIIAWGGASLTLGEIKGWDELKGGEVTEAEGLVALDDQTLEITLNLPFPTWPFNMSAAHTGISKLDQVLSDENWWQYPVAAGPFSLAIDPDSGLTVVSSGAQWWGEDSILEKMVLENIPDRQVQVIMFENRELDMMELDGPTYSAALDPSHPFNPLLKKTPGGGLFYFIAHVARPPLEDLFVRKAMASAVDMRTILTAVLGPTTRMATGLISPTINCHDPDAPGQTYDPDLARQYLSESSYGSAANLPVLKTDVSYAPIVPISAAMKEYWKDNLDVELDIVRRERGIGRRDDSQWSRHSAGSWSPDPVQIVSTMTVKDIGELDNVPGVYDVMDALEAYARSLPLDHPDRCAAFQAVEREFIDQVYMIPLWSILGNNWVVQPWVRGYESTFNREVNVWEIFIQKH